MRLTLALLLTGCGIIHTGPPPHKAGGFFFEQPIYQPAYIEATLKAAADWERVTGSDLFNEGAPVYVRQFPGVVEYGDGGRADGVAYRRARTIVLNASADPGRLYPIAAHELGHVLGLGHSDNPDDLMAPTVGPGHTITPNDAASARKALGRPSL